MIDIMPSIIVTLFTDFHAGMVLGLAWATTALIAYRISRTAVENTARGRARGDRDPRQPSFSISPIQAHSCRASGGCSESPSTQRFAQDRPGIRA